MIWLAAMFGVLIVIVAIRSVLEWFGRKGSAETFGKGAVAFGLLWFKLIAVLLVVLFVYAYFTGPRG